MKILAIETSAPVGSIALWGADGCIETVQFEGERNHARQLAPKTKHLLDRHGGLTAIDGYAISIGPGSFTGLRIGVSFVKGLAAVVPRPAVGISTLRVMAAQGHAYDPTGERYLALQDARRREVFAGLYRATGEADPLVPDGLYPVEALEGHIEAHAGGERWRAVGDRVVERPSNMIWLPATTPQASTVARLAATLLAEGQGTDAGALDPAYHQLSAAEVTFGVRVPHDAALHLQGDAGEVDPTPGRT